MLVLCVVVQSCLTICDPIDCSPPGSSVHGDFSRQEYWSGFPCPPPGHLPNPGIEARSPTLQADSLPSEPPGKPKNTGMGSLPLLQGIFLTQVSNPGLPHCRQILYRLSHQDSIPILSQVAKLLFERIFNISRVANFLRPEPRGEKHSTEWSHEMAVNYKRFKQSTALPPEHRVHICSLYSELTILPYML